MPPPRWFYPLVGICLLALTLAVVLRLRRQPVRGFSENRAAWIDTWRGQFCQIEGCIPLRYTAPQP